MVFIEKNFGLREDRFAGKKQTFFCLKCSSIQLNEIKFEFLFFYPDKFNFASFMWPRAVLV